MHDSEHPRKLRKFIKQHNFGVGGWWACATVPEVLAVDTLFIEHLAEELKSVAGSLVEYDKATRTYTIASWGLSLAAAEVELQALVGRLLPGYHL